MRKRFLSLVFGVLLFGAPASAKMATLSTFTLKNGLEVLVLPNPRAPLIYHKLVYKVGSLQDPLGKGGIAHLLEHLMFRGTARVKDGEYNRLTDLYGMQNNASTSHTVTDYYTFSDISKLELAMALEADRLHNLALREDAVTAERNIVFQERLQRVENSPSSLFWEMMPTLLWQDNPPSRPVTGRPDEIKSLTLADVQAFYHRWYQPQNAILLLSGDITVAEAQTLAEKYYGKLENTSPLPEPVSPYKLSPVQLTTTAVLPDITVPKFVRYYRLPQGLLSKREEIALLLLADYLSDDETSYLPNRLVHQQNDLAAVDMGFGYTPQYGGLLTVQAVPDKIMPEVNTLSALLDTALTEGIAAFTEADLAKIKHKFTYDALYAADSLSGLAQWALDLYLDGYTPEEITDYDRLIASVTREEILSAWQKVIATDGVINALLTTPNGGKPHEKP